MEKLVSYFLKQHTIIRRRLAADNGGNTFFLAEFRMYQ